MYMYVMCTVKLDLESTCTPPLMPPLVFLPYELLVEEKGMITMYSILFIRLNAKRIHSVMGSLGRLFGSETASDLGPFSP